MWSRFELGPVQLEETAKLLEKRIREGLADHGQEVACYPAYVYRPVSPISGTALVLDAGGTNMRAARISLTENSHVVEAGPVSGPLPVGRDKPIDYKYFFDSQAGIVSKVCEGEEPLGYCFSYPIDVHEDRDATLVRWTKEVRVSGVEGNRVGRLLRESLDQVEAEVGEITLLNDTVACLMAATTLEEAADADGIIGLIVGTGTNMAGFVPYGGFSKSGVRHQEGLAMAVNLESGNFSPNVLTRADDEVDRASENPGRQRFEKAVSGVYLGQVLAREVPAAGFDPQTGSKGLVDLLGDEAGDPRARELAKTLLDRSADLVASALAGFARVILPQGGKLLIQAEGGLYWGARGYHQRVSQTLEKVLGSTFQVRIRTIENANLIGSAVAALS